MLDESLVESGELSGIPSSDVNLGVGEYSHSKVLHIIVIEIVLDNEDV